MERKTKRLGLVRVRLWREMEGYLGSVMGRRKREPYICEWGGEEPYKLLGKKRGQYLLLVSNIILVDLFLSSLYFIRIMT